MRTTSRNKSKQCFAVMLALLLGIAWTAIDANQAFAQKKQVKSSSTKSTKTKAKSKKRTRKKSKKKRRAATSRKKDDKRFISFEGSVIEGKIVRPDGFFLLRRGKNKFSNLVKVRKNFNDELREMKYHF